MPTPHGNRTTDALFIALPVVLVLILYAGSFRYPPVFDDRGFILGLLEHYTSAGFGFDLRWVAYKTFGWTYAVFGTDIRWYRAGNIVLHGMVASALFVFFARLYAAVLKPGDCAVAPRWLAGGGALLFALHPAAVYARSSSNGSINRIASKSDRLAVTTVAPIARAPSAISTSFTSDADRTSRPASFRRRSTDPARSNAAIDGAISRSLPR